MLRIHAHARWVALHNLCKHMRTGASRMQAVGPNVESASYFLCIYLLAHPLKTATTVSTSSRHTHELGSGVTHTRTNNMSAGDMPPPHAFIFNARVILCRLFFNVWQMLL